MRLLVSGATKVMTEQAAEGIRLGCLGVLVVPAAGNKVTFARDAGFPAAADNSAFTGFDAGAFCRMLGACADSGVKLDWIACPDVVCDDAGTFRLWGIWRKRIEAFGYRPALVLQNGMTVLDLCSFDPPAVFIGGDDGFKLGADVRKMVAWANAEGRPVHMGRVNSLKRILYAEKIGCQSFDGRKWSAWSRTYIPKWVAWCRRRTKQGTLC